MYEALRERGAKVFPAHVYRWELPEDTRPLKEASPSHVRGKVDVVMFTSSVQLAHAMKIAAELNLESDFLDGFQRVVSRPSGLNLGHADALMESMWTSNRHTQGWGFW